MQTFSQKCLCLFKKATEKQKKDYCSFLCWLATKRKKKVLQTAKDSDGFVSKIAWSEGPDVDFPGRAAPAYFAPNSPQRQKAPSKRSETVKKQGPEKKTDCFFFCFRYFPLFIFFSGPKAVHTFIKVHKTLKIH